MLVTPTATAADLSCDLPYKLNGEGGREERDDDGDDDDDVVALRPSFPLSVGGRKDRPRMRPRRRRRFAPPTVLLAPSVSRVALSSSQSQFPRAEECPSGRLIFGLIHRFFKRATRQGSWLHWRRRRRRHTSRRPPAWGGGLGVFGGVFALRVANGD